MTQIKDIFSSYSTSYGTRIWTYLEAELLKGNALLLPLRLFIGLGWMRAGVEKLIDPLWRSGDSVLVFFQSQISADAVYFPFYETLITQVFAPHALVLSWLILIGELLAGIAILAGIFTTLALLAGLFMNLNFVLAGVVNPSAFYIVIQVTLLAANAGKAPGGDSVLVRYVRYFFPTIPTSLESSDRALKKWSWLFSGIVSSVVAALVVPYIRDFGPHSVDDPAMLLFILLMLGAMQAGIQFIRITTEHTNARAWSLRLAGHVQTVRK